MHFFKICERGGKMKPIKSERLRKLETELQDLEQWLKLGLVPKKDLDKHKEEMKSLKVKIEEEKERLHYLKEGGEAEEFIVPKRQAAKAGYNEMPTIPDIDIAETGSGLTDAGFEMETYLSEESSFDEDAEGAEEGKSGEFEEEKDKEEVEEVEEDESYFSDKNRWRRGGILDPDADEW